MYNILLVEPDDEFLAVLVNRLGSQSNVTVHGVSDSATALEVMEQQARLDLIITAAHEPGSIDGFQLVLAARDTASKARLIVSTSLNAAQMQTISNHSVARYVPRAINPDDLTILSQQALAGAEGAAGKLGDLELLDVVVMACACERTATLHVRQGNHKGRIIFREGRLEHAELGPLTGPDALFELLSLQQGDIFLQGRIEEYERSIHDPWADVLSKGLDSLPERRARHGSDDEQGAASITEDDVALLGLGDPEDEDEDEENAFFSQEELADLGDLDIPEPSMPKFSQTPMEADNTPVLLGRPAQTPSGRRFAKISPPSAITAPPPAPQHPPQRPATSSAGLSTGLREALTRLQYDVPEFIAVDIIHGAEGMSLGSMQTGTQYDSTIASAYYGDMVHACIQGISGFGLPPELEDIQITTNRHYILLRAVSGTPYVVLLLMGREGNLGIARVVLRRCEGLLAQLLPH